MGSVESSIHQHHSEAVAWRSETGDDIKDIKKTVTGLTSLADQAKGASWLAGILLSAMGALSLVGLKVVLDWLLAHH